MNEEEIRKNIITEMIIEKLFNSLRRSSTGKVRFDSYRINEDDIAYLLEKYDAKKYNEYKNMLLNIKDEDEDEDE
jgi:aminopeptidase-like protein